MAQPFQLLDECAASLGDSFTLQFSRAGTHVVLSHPRDVRAVFNGDRSLMYAGRGNQLLAPILGRHSLLMADGDEHTRQRAMLQPAFRAERMRDYAHVVVDVTRRHMVRWGDDRVIAVQRAALEISKEIILRVVFGLASDEAEILGKHVDRFMAIVGTNATFDDEGCDQRVLARFREVRTALDLAIQEQIETRRLSATMSGDMLSLLLAQTPPPSDAEIRDQLLTMILAGHETTASSITWALFCLSEAPQALALLYAELDASMDLPEGRLGELPYLQAVCLETLRLRPVVPVVSRELQGPFRLGEHELPAGIFVTPCAYLAHRRPDAFPDPDRFEPARFVGARFSPYEYFPFGGGVHRCLGMVFALLEMQIVVGMLLRDLEFQSIEPIRPIRRAVTVVASGGGRMYVRRRTR